MWVLAVKQEHGQDVVRQVAFSDLAAPEPLDLRRAGGSSRADKVTLELRVRGSNERPHRLRVFRVEDRGALRERVDVSHQRAGIVEARRVVLDARAPRGENDA